MFFQLHIAPPAAALTLPARRCLVADEMCGEPNNINDNACWSPLTFGSLREGAEPRPAQVLTFDMVRGSWLSGQGSSSGVTMVRMR